ncbi:TonB-linked outer membrane protein, SusC/RagA family [Mariniphaga anaerophila]|uniref:TonB-linked outer membrane protein, SusC/RagA family n=1 Tax=Mariniphaga anaerophila TaxID=1484053 RepID=A0A1M4SKG3_9BACT|nr:TonB-dependent receptor [Mariniphaga anaerophila]SHE32642.1 TonB-linked outer membrane protein, SusC/RagA family [Mariniphaga anaerophila]
MKKKRRKSEFLLWARVVSGRISSRFLFALLITFYSSISIPMYAQSDVLLKVGGKITDVKGEAIIGAAVSVVGKAEGVVSDVNGYYELSVTKGAKLNFSFLGYTSKTVEVKDQKPLNVILEEDIKEFDEVVVVGYGAQKKESLSGAISNLSAESIISTKAPSIAQTIQGKVAGLRIRQETGEPGKFASEITLRGFSGAPLFIIDGIASSDGDAFQRLNPDDIESISFLKDATAAIYGMNSDNGAILVTTKKGGLGKPRVSLNSYLSVSAPTKTPRMTTAAEYVELMNDASMNTSGVLHDSKEEIEKWMSGASGYESTDWQDAIFNKSSFQQQHALSIEGGADRVNYFVSVGYAGDNSFLKNKQMCYDKYTFRSNISIKILSNLTANVNLAGRYDKTISPHDSFFEIYKQTRLSLPTETVYANDNPEYLGITKGEFNPAALADRDIAGSRELTNKNIQSVFSLVYNVPYLEGLSVKGQLAYDFDNQVDKGVRRAYNAYTYNILKNEYSPVSYHTPSLIQRGHINADRLNYMAQATYDHTFSEDHQVKATFVFEGRQNKRDWLNVDRKSSFLTIDEIDYGDLADQWMSGSSEEQRFISYIGRVNYAYKQKYLAEVAYRYDGSYRYKPEDRWALFPTASFAWRASEENFIKNNFDFVDNLKIRASAGRSGHDAGEAFQYIAGHRLKEGGYIFKDGVYTNGASARQIINPNLTWIKADLYNIGLDFSIFNGIIATELDFYQRDRKGELAKRNVSLPNTYGADLTEENLNSNRTRGVEVTLTHSNTVQDFYYRVSGNINIARTQNRYVEEGTYTSSYDRWKNQNSNRYGDWIWGYQTEGQFQGMEEIYNAPIQNGELGNSKELPGDYKFMDVNGDGIVDGRDMMPIFWNEIPKIHYGINMEASWKNFDFYMLWQGAAQYTVQFEELYATMLGFKGGNTPAYFYDRWHREDLYDLNSAWIPGKYPAARLEQDMGMFYTRNSDLWRKNASYIRLKSVELGYTFNPKKLKEQGIDRLRIYFNANNLLTFCDSFVKPFDPEKIAGSYSAGLDYPLTQAYTFGLNLTF